MSQGDTKKCNICDGSLRFYHSYENTPPIAQHFPEEVGNEPGITLNIFECTGCGAVQCAQDHLVSYWDHAIRSTPWNQDPWRKKQRQKFVEEFGLENKKIRNITRKPKEEDSYDAFLMIQYLEHFPNPKEALIQIRNHLPEGGVGIIEVPNFDGIIKDRIFGEFIIDHLWYFTQRTFRFVIEAAGFEVLRIGDIWGGASISATVRKRAPLSNSPFVENEKELIQDIDNFINGFDSATIWGVGHQTLMMLPMMNCLDKIPYVVDNFKIKQNKYTPVTYKKVLSSENLKDNPVDAILIMVGWQYEHVLNDIKELNLDPLPTIGLIVMADLEILPDSEYVNEDWTKKNEF